MIDLFILFEVLVFQMKASKMVITIIIVFFLCWIPNEISAAISILEDLVPSLQSTLLFFFSCSKATICYIHCCIHVYFC